LIIVDDERVIREGLSTMVNWTELDFKVESVFADGREALAYLSDHAIDVILTDIRMTFVSGLDLAREVRSLAGQTRVVLLSGHREFELAQQAVAAGVYDYLLKPVDFGELRRVFGNLAATLGSEKSEREALQRDAEERERERLILLQQFYERVLADGELGSETIAERYRRLGFTDSLRDRPCCLPAISSVRRERLPVLPEAVGNVLAGGDVGTTYTPVILEASSGDDRLVQHVLAHAKEPVSVKDFRERLDVAAHETIVGITTMFGAEIGIRCDACCSDLFDAAGLAHRKEPPAILGSKQGPPVESSRSEDHAGGELASRRRSGWEPPPNRLVAQAQRFLEDHYRQQVGLTEAADAVGVSAPYLSRIFSAQCGVTLIDYLTHLRMERASELLLGGTRSVAEVAEAVGYGSSSHFSRVFKKVIGLSPADYRRGGGRAAKAHQGRAGGPEGEPRPPGTPDIATPEMVAPERQEPATSEKERDNDRFRDITLPGPWERQDPRWSRADEEIIVRRSVEIPESWIGRDLILSLGKIDDSDHTYWNGSRVDRREEKGRWPHNMPRVYDVPGDLVTDTTAVVAVHLFDRANRYDRVFGGGFVGPAGSMWVALREAGLYAADYRYDYVYGDDPYRYFNW
jgi:two-component system response regulator YesN